MGARTTIITSLFIVSTLIIINDAKHNEVSSRVNGAPAGRTGSPGDTLRSCAVCNGGAPVTTQIGWITSNIPVSGRNY